MPTETRHILVIEDEPADFLLLQRHLRKHLPEVLCQRVASDEELTEALSRADWAAFISDYNVPGMNFRETLDRLQRERPDVPVVLVSGSVGEETAVELLKLGVADFVLKGHFARLVSAVERSIAEVAQRRARRLAERALGESQERLSMALAAAQMGVWEWNVATDEFHSTPQSAALFGLPDTVVGVAAFQQAIHPEDREATVNAARRAATTRETFEAEFRVVHPGGEVRWLYSLARARDDQHGVAGQLVGTVQDITARKAAERERQALEDQFRQAQKMEAVGRLASGVAHDFNNLLSIILGYGEALLDEIPPGDQRREDLEAVVEAGERAAGLTRQLLAFSRQQVIAPRALDLNEQVRGLDKLLRRLIGEDVELRLDLAEDLPQVTADPGQLEQVVMNLVVNARDAMPQGGQVSIATGITEVSRHTPALIPVEATGQFLTLTVADNGCGMDPAILERVCEPFFTTKEVGKGTGLGLSTVHGIVQQLGGHLGIESVVGQGSIFRIYLPPRQEAAAQATATAAAAEEDLSGHERVLLVEDEGELRSLLQRVLERNGYQVTAAPNGVLATELAASQAEPIDLIITDVVLPRLSGPQLVREVRHRHPAAAVLYLSGYTDETLLHHQALGAEAVLLSKPFSMQQLLATVRETLNRERAA
ncbi:MAG: response regulator [Armatimonadetes bacterium]|nr:response regulator [Armatimonadota bacterium]